jgi:hypothetical protein
MSLHDVLKDVPLCYVLWCDIFSKECVSSHNIIYLPLSKKCPFVINI